MESFRHKEIKCGNGHQSTSIFQKRTCIRGLRLRTSHCILYG